MDADIYTSRVAFLFLIFAVISGGYISEVLSCQLQKMLSTSHVARHTIGFVMVFVFLMMEGGWSFDSAEDEKASNDWSSGNTVHSLAIALAIYVAFVLSSKMQLVPNLAFYGTLFVMYVVNTYRRFLKARDSIRPQTDAKLRKLNTALFGILLAVFGYGFLDYVAYQHTQHPGDFSWYKFLVGKPKCDGLAGL